MVPGIGDCQASSRIGLWKERGERESRARGEGRQNLTSTLKAAGVVAIRSCDNHE